MKQNDVLQGYIIIACGLSLIGLILVKYLGIIDGLALTFAIFCMKLGKIYNST